MKIIVVGANGTIGKAVAKELEARHQIVKVGHSSGDFQVDIAEPASIEKLFEDTGEFDALVCAAGPAKYGKMNELADSDYLFSFTNKLLGQINLVRRGLNFIKDNGSFTLTSGMFSRVPMPGVTPIATANAGVEAFARAAALEMTRGVRINAVSPSFVKETMEKRGMDSSSGIPAAEVALAYINAVEGSMNGRIIDVQAP